MATDLSRVVAPPYDIVDPPLEKELRERDPHNVIRLTLGKTPPEARPEQEYRCAAEFLARWRQEGVLIQDRVPSLYLVEQAFSLGGQELVRRGFIAALLLEELGKGSVFPHERTSAVARTDMFRLLAACQANLSQVIAIYADPDGAADRAVARLCGGPPLYSFHDGAGVRYRVWRIGARRDIAAIVRLVRGCPFVIADGHHRYESALQYRNARRAQGAAPGSAPEDYVSALCVSVADAGLRALPTHRRVRTNRPITDADLRAALGDRFALHPVPVSGPDSLESALAAARGEDSALGCCLPHKRLFVLRPRDLARLRARFPQEADSWWRLPVSLLHYVVLPDLLDLRPATEEEAARVDYRHEAAEVYAGVESGAFGVGFLLPPTDPCTVVLVATQGQRLPAKSTFFYPKIVSGVVLYGH